MRLASLGIQIALLGSAFAVGLLCGRQGHSSAGGDERALMAGGAKAAASASAAPALATGALAALPPAVAKEAPAGQAEGSTDESADESSADERGADEHGASERARATSAGDGSASSPARTSKSKASRESKASRQSKASKEKEREQRPEPLSWSQVAARAQSWTAAVRADLNYGAGIIVDRSGLVLTNQHVVANTRSVTVTPFGGNPTKAEVIESDSALDLALLRVESAEPLTHVAEVGSAANLGVGDDVLAVGSPRKMFFSVSRGMVSFPARQLDGVSYIQTDLPINEGNSGGPLVDREGRVVGVVSFILKESQGLSFALPIDRALARFAPQLEAARQAQQAEQHVAERPRAEDSPKGETASAQAR